MTQRGKKNFKHSGILKNILITSPKIFFTIRPEKKYKRILEIVLQP